jgi:hypothetical protein
MIFFFQAQLRQLAGLQEIGLACPRRVTLRIAARPPGHRRLFLVLHVRQEIQDAGRAAP